jgi:hypothetical protein
MSAIIQVELPSETFERLEEVARQQRRSVDEIVRAMILQELPELPPLPHALETELEAFGHLSDDVLWLLAKNTLSPSQQAELAELNELSQQRDLTSVEQGRQQTLLALYHQVLVRRAQAAVILKARGHDLDELTAALAE